MTPSEKPEWPSLLPPGLFPMPFSELEAMCVTAFPMSSRRQLIIRGLEAVLKKLDDAKIVAEVWVDGSFLTQKAEPDDADIVVRTCGQSFYDGGTPEQKNLLDAMSVTDLKAEYYCHSFVIYHYPEDHPLYWNGKWADAYWISTFGFSRGRQLKGMAVIQVGCANE